MFTSFLFFCKNFKCTVINNDTSYRGSIFVTTQCMNLFFVKLILEINGNGKDLNYVFRTQYIFLPDTK